jgi:glyoxylase-like metal-dependent hydrolase (beta-lactamase superfamily II)
MDRILRHLTDRVYVLPGDMRRVRPWIGVVVTGEGTVLVDSGNGPLQAVELQAGLDEIGAPPVTHILLTHHHWDHVFGSCAFPEALVIAHELTQYHLQVMAGEPWSREYVLAKAGDDHIQKIIAEMMLAAVPDIDAFQVMPAHVTFTDEYRLTLGNTRLVMEHVGGPHEPDQCVVHVRPGNVLFLGDAAYGRGKIKNWDIDALTAELEGFLEWGADYYVTGHEEPAGREAFRKHIAQLKNR